MPHFLSQEPPSPRNDAAAVSRGHDNATRRRSVARATDAYPQTIGRCAPGTVFIVPCAETARATGSECSDPRGIPDAQSIAARSKFAPRWGFGSSSPELILDDSEVVATTSTHPAARQDGHESSGCLGPHSTSRRCPPRCFGTDRPHPGGTALAPLRLVDAVARQLREATDIWEGSRAADRRDRRLMQLLPVRHLHGRCA